MNRFTRGRFSVRSTFAAASILCVTCLASTAYGQAGSGGTISDGNSFFTMAVSPTSNTGTGPVSADLRVGGAASTDSVFQSWWWYRVNGVHTREFCLANASAWNWAGNTGTQDFTTPEFTARATWMVANLGTDTAKVTASLAITNTTASTLDIALFHYQDFDYGGTSGTDSATLVSPNTIRITDSTAPAPLTTLLAYYQGPGADAYKVTAWATLRGTLADTAITNLDNLGLPFASADWTGSYQFNRMIPAGQTATARVVFGIGAAIPAGCVGDFNNSGSVTVQDIFDFLIAYFANSPAADVNGVGGVTVQDIFDFLISYFAGC
jgi:hypothetical protein